MKVVFFTSWTSYGSDLWREVELDRSNNRLRQCSDFMITNICGRASLGISIPAPTHQLFPAGRGLLFTFHIFGTVVFIHQIKESCHRPPEISERLPPVPHLPQHYAKAVYVCFAVIYLGMKYFRCDIHRGPLQSTRNILCVFRHANISYLRWVFLW